MTESRKGLLALSFIFALYVGGVCYALYSAVNYIIDNYNWINTQPWGKIEYVGACIAVNMALAGWKGFRDRLTAIFDDIDQKTSSFTSYKLDQPAKADKAQKRFFCLSSFAIKILHFVWGLTPSLAVLLVGVGIVSLYLNAYCPWLFVMILPIPVYLITGSIIVPWIKLVYHWNFLSLRPTKGGDDDIDKRVQKLKSDLAIEK